MSLPPLLVKLASAHPASYFHISVRLMLNFILDTRLSYRHCRCRQPTGRSEPSQFLVPTSFHRLHLKTGRTEAEVSWCAQALPYGPTGNRDPAWGGRLRGHRISYKTSSADSPLWPSCRLPPRQILSHSNLDVQLCHY